MARYVGKNGAIEVGAVSIGEVTSFDYEKSINTIQSGVMGNAGTGVDAGQYTYTGSISVLTDPSDAGQTALSAGTKVTLTLYPEGNTTGLSQVTGSFLISSVGKTTTVGSNVETSYSFESDGDVTESAVA